MKKFLVRLLVVLGVIYLLTVVAVVLVISHRGRVPSKTILEANFERQLVEEIADNPAAKVMLSDRGTVRDVVDAIDRALTSVEDSL